MVEPTACHSFHSGPPAGPKSDGAQSLTPEAFDEVAAAVRAVRRVALGEEA